MTASNTSGAEFNVPTDVVNPTITGIDSFTPYTSLGESMIGGSKKGCPKKPRRSKKTRRSRKIGGAKSTPAKPKLPKRSLRKQMLRKQSIQSKNKKIKSMKQNKKQSIREKALRSIATGVDLSKQELQKLSPNMQKFLQQLPKTGKLQTMATAITVDLPTLTSSPKKPTKLSTQRILKQLEKYNVNVRKHGKQINRKYSPAELQFLDGIIHGKVDLTQFQVEKIPKTIKTNRKSKSKLR